MNRIYLFCFFRPYFFLHILKPVYRNELKHRFHLDQEKLLFLLTVNEFLQHEKLQVKGVTFAELQKVAPLTDSI